MGAAAVTTRDREQKRTQLARLEAAIIGGEPVGDAIRSHVAANGLTLRRGLGDYRQLRDRWARLERIERERADVNRYVALRRFDGIYRRAAEADNLAVALQAEVQMCKLLGLYTEGGSCSAG